MSDAARGKAQLTMCFGAMTWPHFVVGVSYLNGSPGHSRSLPGILITGIRSKAECEWV